MSLPQLMGGSMCCSIKFPKSYNLPAKHVIFFHGPWKQTMGEGTDKGNNIPVFLVETPKTVHS